MDYKILDRVIWKGEMNAFNCPDTKFFWLWLLTNGHINCAGIISCSEQVAMNELSFTKETYESMLKGFKENFGLIDYDEGTGEILVKDWDKYNWTKSPKFQDGLYKVISAIASKTLRDEQIERYKVFYGEGGEIALEGLETAENDIPADSPEDESHLYGQYRRIKMTLGQYQKLCAAYGSDYTDQVIDKLDEYVESNNNKNKYTNFYLVIKKCIRERWSLIKNIPQNFSAEKKSDDNVENY